MAQRSTRFVRESSCMASAGGRPPPPRRHTVLKRSRQEPSMTVKGLEPASPGSPVRLTVKLRHWPTTVLLPSAAQGTMESTDCRTLAPVHRATAERMCAGTPRTREMFLLRSFSCAICETPPWHNNSAGFGCRSSAILSTLRSMKSASWRRRSSSRVSRWSWSKLRGSRSSARWQPGMSLRIFRWAMSREKTTPSTHCESVICPPGMRLTLT
mmetsp:Transcript_20997/g.60610  ORF Transcript_20997/g.60610 Transcript_20997/m.60610 type:complete len:212 (-) Transcript_20997:198-833(-)